MGSSKMNTINDPLTTQKLAAANQGLQNYQTASSAIPSLQNYYGQNFGQTQQQTLQNQSPLFQDIYGQTQQGVQGGQGPYASLTQNLLGSFDAGNAQNNQNLDQQIQAQGLMGSGAGMAVLGNQGVQAAQARAGVQDQSQVNMLNMANQLAQELAQQNQIQGFQNPMSAQQQIGALAQPPQFQDINNTYYTPQSKFQTTADILGAVSQAAQNGVFNPQTYSGMGNSVGANPMSSLGAFQQPGMGINPTQNPLSSFYGPSNSQLLGPMTLAAMGG